MVPLPVLFATALRHHQAGLPHLAEPVLRDILAVAPRHGGALHLLGVIAYDSGRFDLAADCFRQAVAVHPDEAFFHSTLGAAYQALGRLDEAAACHREALRLQPGNPAALSNLGVTLAAQGQDDDACAIFRQAVDAAPDDPDLHSNLAAVLRRLGRLDEARAACRQALRLRPDHPQAHLNLGNVLRDQADADAALDCYQTAVRLAPGLAPAHVALGHALRDRGRLDDAAGAYQNALRLQPSAVEAHTGLGQVLLARARPADALACYRQALRLSPDCAEAHIGAGNALAALADLDAAAAAYQEAVQIAPNLAAAHYDLALVRQNQGRLAEAQAGYQDALALDPSDHVAHSTYLGSLLYDPAVEPADLLAEHRRWAERHAAAWPEPPAHANPPDPNRRLRVGYVSPDLRCHALAAVLRPVLAHHDPARVEVFCYAEVAAPDVMTAELRRLAPGWRDVYGVSDDRLAELIRADGIDVLVDLAGHTAGNRQRVFARRPAPVQVSYLGYPATTGLPAIGYRLGDRVTDPEGEPTDSVEEVVRLPRVFCCYAPSSEAPPVSDLPALRTGAVTFGALHKLPKLNDTVLDVWCRLLHALPGARLLLARETLHGPTAAALAERFARRGIDPGRLDLRRVRPVGMAHLRLYADIDVALDAFPWTGHTTACEALWQGVPVVTLRGRQHAGRMVASVLSCVGLAGLVADSPDEYVRLAVELAADLPRLADLRAGLRRRVADSPLRDAAGFTRSLEDAYRRMWQRWCS